MKNQEKLQFHYVSNIFYIEKCFYNIIMLNFTLSLSYGDEYANICILASGPCADGETLTGENGTISSPGYAADGNGYYLHNQDCYWIIEPNSVSFVHYYPTLYHKQY